MEERIATPAIYISYAWNAESESIVASIEEEFQNKGIRIIRDKNDLKYKGRIKEFMEQIGRGKYVILIISNKYLQSENCMFELLQIFKNQNFYERIFPLVLDEVKIAKAADRLDLVQYWENEAEQLDLKIRNLKALSNIQGVADDLNLYTEIRNNVARLTNILKDINTLNTDRHIKSDFEQLYNLIQSKIEVDSDTNKNGDQGHNKYKVLKKVAVGFVGLLAVLLIFQVANSKFRDDNLKALPVEKKPEAIIKDSTFNHDGDVITDTTIKEPSGKIENTESSVTYDVILVVPSNMVSADVFVDNKKAEIIQRAGIFLTIRLRKKDSSHHFEIKKGSESCFTDRLILKDGIKLPMCD